jgi:multidrug transporter EmrE-like cation transporter
MKVPQTGIYGYCLTLSACMCFGQILFKMASLQQPQDSFSFTKLLLSPWFLGAVTLYGLTTFLWVYILARMPLSVAYPFSLIGAALVPMAGYLLFGEPLAPRFWIGLGLVLSGLYVINVA